MRGSVPCQLPMGKAQKHIPWESVSFVEYQVTLKPHPPRLCKTGEESKHA